MICDVDAQLMQAKGFLKSPNLEKKILKTNPQET